MTNGAHSSLRERENYVRKDVDDTWVLLTVFSKSHSYPTKRLLAFSQPTAHSSFSTSHSPQQFFQKPQLN